MKSPRLLSAFAFAAACGATSLFAQINLASLPSSDGGTVYTYTQDFNSLPAQSTTNPTPADSLSRAVLNDALPGWFFNLGTTTGSDATFNAFTSDGVQSSATIPSVRNYGGTNSTDRALGLYVGTSSVLGSGAMGMAFESGFSDRNVTSLTVSYTGELWRRASDGRLDFSYMIVDSFDADTFNFRTTAGWIDADALDFAAPVTGSGAGLDGNATANRAFVHATIELGTALAPGRYLLVRWHDATRAGMAIDDLSVSFTTAAAIPEPSTYAALFGALALGATMIVRRRRQR